MWFIRIGAYILSGLTVWQFIQSGVNITDVLPQQKHLILDQMHGMIFGVCAGISNYTGIDVTLLRFAWILTGLYRGIGIAIYLLAFLIMPTG